MHNFVRTLSMYCVLRGMAEDESHVDRFLEEYAGKLAAASKSEIMSRDLAFAQQGLKMAARQLGDRIIEPVEEGFKRAHPGLNRYTAKKKGPSGELEGPLSMLNKLGS